MKGLDIAHEFFLEWGLPYLQDDWPELSNRIAAGRFDGSDVLGADDEISRDHNWGPQFTLFLSADDYTEYGTLLSEQANASAPRKWNGYRVAGAGDKNVVVESIPAWFEKRLGITQPPRSHDEWMRLLEHESALYFLRHGALWLDASGELSTWRAALHEWPEHALTRRLADECFRTWHHGEYNFAQRMAKRRDPLAIAMCLGEFVTGVMRIVLLIHGDYTPYWKWLAFEFRKRQEASAYVPLLERLVDSPNIGEQVELITDISERVHRELVSSGRVSGTGGNAFLLPLLNDWNELNGRLTQFPE